MKRRQKHRGVTYEAHEQSTGKWIARILPASAVYVRATGKLKEWPTKERAELGARLEIDRRLLDEPTQRKAKR